MNKLTQVEQKIFEAWKREMPFVQIDTHIDMIRERTKEIAYHEAGHAAAYAFFGDNHTHFNGLSIIPCSEHLGVFSQANVFKFFLTGILRLDWIKGCWIISELLAGRMAGKRFNYDDFEPIEDSILNGWESTLCESEEEWLSTADEGKAFKIAEQISKRGWPPMRILNMVEGWTDELLNIPIVWGVVEKLAQRLLEVGEITDFEEYENFVEPILFQCHSFPKWKRRFMIK